MVTRVGGLASGMDIDSIVEKLMSAEKAPLNKLYQQQQKYEWQRDAYREVNTSLSTFDSYLFDNFRLSSNFYKKTVSSSNSSLVNATATSSATGSLSIDNVTQLAKSAQKAVTIPPNNGVITTGSTKIVDLVPSLVKDSTFTLSAINSSGTLSNKEITIAENETVDSLLKKINSSGAGVTALLENGQISISANNTGNITSGSGAEISVSAGDGATLFNKLGFTNTLNGDGSLDLASDGKNAIFSVNGINNTERNSNTFSINGYTVTLNSTFNSGTPVTLTSSTDTDNMVTKIKEFVDTYNGLITNINSKLKESYNRNYQPLTEEQKKDMETDEITSWETKAKKGLLRNDSILTNGLYDLRRTFSSNVVGLGDSTMDSLAEIGITTSSVTSDRGKLVIKEDKLRAAIEKNPDQVASIFTKTGEVTTKTVNGKKVTEDSRGIAQRLRDELKDFTTNIEKKAGKTTSTNQTFTIGKRLAEIEDKISSWEDRLGDIESRYWKQFTAMETAINKANSQSSIFASA